MILRTAYSFDRSDVNDAYRAVDLFLKKKAFDLINLDGIEEHEAHSATHLAFCYAFNSWDEQGGAAFTTWIAWYLRGIRRLIIKQRKRHRCCVAMDDAIAMPQDYVAEVLSRLSSDGRFVVRLCLCPPDDVDNRLLMTSGKTGGRAAKRGIAKDALYRHLRQRGWDRQRILAAFDEIRDSLTQHASTHV